MKSFRINRLSIALGAALLGLALSGCGNKGAGGPADANAADSKEAVDTAIPVEVARARKQPIVASYTGTASLEADRQADVVARASGVLLKLHVEEGDVVKEGQLLAELDAERAKLEVARADANMKRLEHDYERSQELYRAKLTSAELNDKVKFELDTQRAAYDLMKLELSYTRIVAPIEGVISERMVKEGNLIQLQQAMFRIDDFDPLLAVLNVPERELSILKPGLPVSMAVDALPGKKFTGTVARVSPIVDKGTGTFRVTCEFHDETGQIKSGMFGRISVVYAEKEDALVIPREGLIEEDGETAVLVVVDEIPKPADEKKDGDKKDAKTVAKDGKDAKPLPKKPVPIAHRRKVVVGYTAGDRVEIREGLAENDRVITIGRGAVRDGTQVQVLEAQQ
ncbi:MAG TPA: efflux RND transporter periplasmic adaptor subunit [Xanthomonadales bacterium]|nr:efflux RND transporter periplasmic adaptor subunit [Xanthomonadales bacterium]